MRLTAAVLVAPLALSAMLVVSSCVDDDFADGQFLCSPTGGADECPSGMECDKNGRCRRPADADACSPRSCDEIAPLCGALDDGCGGLLACGCRSPLSCGGAGVSGECGCLPESVVERSSRALYNDLSVGGVAWSDVELAMRSDDLHAVAALADGETSVYLKAADFRFQLPLGAVVRGIEVIIERLANVDAVIVDDEVRVVVDGQLLPKIAAETATWSTLQTEAFYGSATDVWESVEPISAALLNKGNFGIALRVQATGGAAEASVDAIRIQVHFANPACRGGAGS